MNKIRAFIFIWMILILFINDHYLKYEYPGAFTGKLSDVCGLMAFPVFLNLIFPARIIVHYFIAASLFVFWKMEASQPLIDVLNEILPFTVQRVLDYTDLFALIVLPVSYHVFYSDQPFELRYSKMICYPLLFGGFIVFSATSYIRPKPLYVNAQYTVGKTPSEIHELWNDKDSSRKDYVQIDTNYYKNNRNAEAVWIRNVVMYPDKIGDTSTYYPTLQDFTLVILNDTLNISSGSSIIYFNYVSSPPYRTHYRVREYKKWFEKNYIDILK